MGRDDEVFVGEPEVEALGGIAEGHEGEEAALETAQLLDRVLENADTVDFRLLYRSKTTFQFDAGQLLKQAIEVSPRALPSASPRNGKAVV